MTLETPSGAWGVSQELKDAIQLDTKGTIWGPRMA